MRVFLTLIGLCLFSVFWFFSTPIYFASDVCQWVDSRLDRMIGELFGSDDDFGGMA